MFADQLYSGEVFELKLLLGGRIILIYFSVILYPSNMLINLKNKNKNLSCACLV